MTYGNFAHKCFQNCKCYNLYLKKEIKVKDYEKCYKRMTHNKKLIVDFLIRYWPNKSK